MSDYTPEVGHRVEVVTRDTGVVREVHDNGFLLEYDGGEQGACIYVREDEPGRTVTRLPDPEPDWQPGDVVKDANGRLFARRYGWTHTLQWRAIGRGELAYSDFNMARPLTPLVLNGEAVTS